MKRLELMFELSNKARVGIMRLAAGKPVRHREIMLGSGLAPSEVTRHVGRLMDIGILTKNRNGSFEISRFGKIILEQLEGFEYLDSNSQYFEHHDMSAIPPGFDTVSMLRTCEKIEGTMDVFNAILGINTASRNYINCMLGEFNNALVLCQNEKLRGGVELNIVVESGKRLPVEYMDNRSMAISVKSLGDIPLFYMANESEALVCFKNREKKVDYSVAFHSSKPAFLEWCDILFNHYWFQGRDITL